MRWIRLVDWGELDWLIEMNQICWSRWIRSIDRYLDLTYDYHRDSRIWYEKYRNFIEFAGVVRQSFCIVSDKSPKTMRKLRFFTKCPHQEIGWNYGDSRIISLYNFVDLCIYIRGDVYYILVYVAVLLQETLWFKPSRPDLGQREKINLNFNFHTSLWCLRRFYKVI